MFYKLKVLVIKVKEKVLNVILKFYLTKITSLSILYTCIFSISWLICLYKFNNLQLEIINYNKQINQISFDKKFWFINDCINDSVLMYKNTEKPPQEIMLNIQENCIINNKLDINKLYNLVKEKKSLNKELAIWSEDFAIWVEFKNKNQDVIKNLNYIENEIKTNNNIKENIKGINDKISILNKTQIKLLLGLFLLIVSDILLKIYN